MTSFLDALKAKSNNVTATLQPTPTPKPSVPDYVLTIEIVTNAKRIDLFFSKNPGTVVCDALKKHYFRYDGDRICWHNIDNASNRAWINEYFGTEIDIETKETPIIPEPEPVQTLESIDRDSPFGIYRRQVNELIAELKCAPADLMLLAIDLLHKTTFGKDC